MAGPRRGSGFLIGRVFGIPIYLHASWLIIFLLITLSLRTQFTAQHPRWTPAQHWTLGLLTSFLFFASVVFHELSHSVVAMAYKIPVRSITLFVFGGISSIEQEPKRPLQEFWIAIAGPLSSILLAGVFWLIHSSGVGGDMVAAAAYWLADINLALGLFNLVPGFPLDGGRVLRGIAWGVTKDFDRATQIAAAAGKFIAFLMIFAGIWSALSGQGLGGLWLAFIGWFLLEAARESSAMVAIQHNLAGVRASDIMSKDVPTISRASSLDEYVHDVMRTGRRAYMVVDGERPVGLVTLPSARSVPRDEWPHTSIQAVMLPIEKIHAASPDEPALQVLQRMQAEDINQMPVISGDRVLGIIGRDSILRALQTRIQANRLNAA
jgi:Zn-dependent protease/predicted transcriptional regulator